MKKSLLRFKLISNYTSNSTDTIITLIEVMKLKSMLYYIKNRTTHIQLFYKLQKLLFILSLFQF